MFDSFWKLFVHAIFLLLCLCILYSNNSVVLLNILNTLDLCDVEIKIKIGKIGVSLEIKLKYFKKTYKFSTKL